MKLLILVLVFFTHNKYVLCDRQGGLWGYLAHKMKEISIYLRIALGNLMMQMKDVVVSNPAPKVVIDPVRKHADRGWEKSDEKAVMEYIHEETDRPEFMHLNSKPDMLLGTAQLAFWHGRSMESHKVRTKDGYLLTLHRLVGNPDALPDRIVLLHHGFLGSSTDWILLGPKHSLPYILSDAGYDVWIANARGNYYSRRHISMTIDFPDFWQFSFEEMGVYDLPAVIDYIKKTRQTKVPINFIGHSMGATAFLVLLSELPQYHEYFRMGIFLAPLAYMNNVRGPLKLLAGLPDDMIKMMGESEFLPTRKVPSWLANKYCKGPISFCSNPLLFLTGIPGPNWSASFIARLMYHIPAGGSTDTFLHYLQMVHNKKFHKFGDPDTEFILNNITLPVAFLSSSDDLVATMPDVLKLYFVLKNPIDHYIIHGRNMTHTDFVWGSEAKTVVFDKVIEYLEKGLVWNAIYSNEVYS